MPKDDETIRLTDFGQVTSSEPPGFTHDQMIRCDECLRANPPTRINCLYCAAALTATSEVHHLRKPTLRPPEKHQPGYNVILSLPRAPSELNGSDTEAAGLLKLAPEDFRRILLANNLLPVARTASREEAELVRERLAAAFGLTAVTISDQELGQPEESVSRVRSLKLGSAGIVIPEHNRREVVELGWSQIKLLVLGRLLQKRTELTELKSRTSENEILNASEFFADEAALDLYAEGSAQTWRITAGGFDFSCLGEAKTLLASENMNRLLDHLVRKAHAAEVDQNYYALKPALEPVWPSEQETISKGWRRERPGRISLGATMITSNESQFTRYSRMRFYFSEHNVE